MDNIYIEALKEPLYYSVRKLLLEYNYLDSRKYHGHIVIPGKPNKEFAAKYKKLVKPMIKVDIQSWLYSKCKNRYVHDNTNKIWCTNHFCIGGCDNCLGDGYMGHPLIYGFKFDNVLNNINDMYYAFFISELKNIPREDFSDIEIGKFKEKIREEYKNSEKPKTSIEFINQFINIYEEIINEILGEYIENWSASYSLEYNITDKESNINIENNYLISEDDYRFIFPLHKKIFIYVEIPILKYNCKSARK